MKTAQAQQYLANAGVHATVSNVYTEGDYLNISATPTDMVLPEFPSAVSIPGYENNDWWISNDGDIHWEFARQQLQPEDLTNSEWKCIQVRDATLLFKPTGTTANVNALPELPEGYQYTTDPTFRACRIERGYSSV